MLTHYCMYKPKPPLSKFVELFWLHDGYHPSHAKERVLPNGSLELTINLRDDTLRIYDQHNTDQYKQFRGSVIGGTHSEFLILDTASQTSTIGVHFKPGGAFPFFMLPVGELHNEVVSLDTLWGSTVLDLRDQLLEAATAEAKFDILEQFLLARLSRPSQRHPAVAYALKELLNIPHTQTIADISRKISLSSRRLIQVFRDEVGLTPKLFCRIRRFQHVLHQIENGQKVEWTDIALACGYFDQAHFIHDFRSFSGLNPSDYLLHRGEHFNHVPLHD